MAEKDTKSSSSTSSKETDVANPSNDVVFGGVSTGAAGNQQNREALAQKEKERAKKETG